MEANDQFLLYAEQQTNSAQVVCLVTEFGYNCLQYIDTKSTTFLYHYLSTQLETGNIHKYRKSRGEYHLGRIHEHLTNTSAARHRATCKIIYNGFVGDAKLLVPYCLWNHSPLPFITWTVTFLAYSTSMRHILCWNFSVDRSSRSFCSLP